ncbi:hypothetical protein GCM10029976_077070 [Kribbella albertanoniae]
MSHETGGRGRRTGAGVKVEAIADPEQRTDLGVVDAERVRNRPGRDETWAEEAGVGEWFAGSDRPGQYASGKICAGSQRSRGHGIGREFERAQVIRSGHSSAG